MQSHRPLPALAAMLLSACFAPEYPANRPCGADGWCPPGQDCIEMVCRLPDYMPPRLDASVRDGAAFDGPASDATPLPANNADLAELLSWGLDQYRTVWVIERSRTYARARSPYDRPDVRLGHR